MSWEKERIEAVYRERSGLSRRYSLEIPGNEFNHQNLCVALRGLLAVAFADLSTVKLLDVGCGELFWPEAIIEMGCARNNCFGTDILHWRLVKGREEGRRVSAVTSSAMELPFASGSLDLVTQFTLMTSVLDNALRRNIADEMRRVLKPGGYILWYDFRYNNPFNQHTRAIGRAEVGHLFPGMPIRTRSITLLPPLARKLKGPLVPLLKILNFFPIMRSHNVALIGPKEAS